MYQLYVVPTWPDLDARFEATLATSISTRNRVFFFLNKNSLARQITAGIVSDRWFRHQFRVRTYAVTRNQSTSISFGRLTRAINVIQTRTNLNSSRRNYMV